MPLGKVQFCELAEKLPSIFIVDVCAFLGILTAPEIEDDSIFLHHYDPLLPSFIPVDSTETASMAHAICRVLRSCRNSEIIVSIINGLGRISMITVSAIAFFHSEYLAMHVNSFYFPVYPFSPASVGRSTRFCSPRIPRIGGYLGIAVGANKGIQALRKRNYAVIRWLNNCMSLFRMIHKANISTLPEVCNAAL